MAREQRVATEEGQEEELERASSGSWGIVCAVVLVALIAAGFWMYSAGVRSDLAGLRSDVGNLERDMYDKVGKVPRLAADVALHLRDMNAQLDSIEARLNGHARAAGVRAGMTEDQLGVDHTRRLVALSGFATGSSELTKQMERRLDEMVAMIPEGWTVRIVVGFADPTPYIVAGEDKNPELSLMRARTVAAHLAGKLSMAVPSDGRGSTAKFGSLDVNRSVLIYLERGK